MIAASRVPTTRYRGMRWSPKRGVWDAHAYFAGKTHFVGSFEREEDAALAGDRVLLGHGSAPRNFPARRLKPASVAEMRAWASELARKRLQRTGRLGKRTTEFRGVRLKANVFRAYVQRGKRSLLLGSYGDARTAAIVRDRAVLFLGLEQDLNFPQRAAKLGPCSPEELRRQARLDAKRAAKSRYFGVAPNPYSEGWDARLTVDRKPVYIARYPTEGEAARAHDRARLALVGRRRESLNFPDEKLRPASIAKLRAESAAAWPETRSSALYGVQKARRAGEWQWLAIITVDFANVLLGTWRTEREAAMAHDRAALHLPGPRRKLNYPAAARKLGAATPTQLRAEARRQMKETTSSKYRGVHWSKKEEVWVAAIGHRSKPYRLGSFHDEERAAEAYDTAARKLHKRRAVLNFPENEHEAAPLRGRGTRPVKRRQTSRVSPSK
jgi:hypothetical protein